MATNFQPDAGSDGHPREVRHDHSSAEPPAGGRTDQHSMVAAAHTAVHGSGSTDRLAAIGGLDVPPGDAAATGDLSVEDPAASMIPGAREANTLTSREPGSMGGVLGGADIPSEAPDWLGDRTARDRRLEGGGHYGIRDRKHEEGG